MRFRERYMHSIVRLAGRAKPGQKIVHAVRFTAVGAQLSIAHARQEEEQQERLVLRLLHNGRS